MFGRNGNPDRYYLDNRQVTEGEYRAAFPERPLESVPYMPRSYPTPQPSDALAVHPKQVKEATEYARSRGVPTDYLPDGRPLVRSCAHQKALAKLSGARPMRGY